MSKFFHLSKRRTRKVQRRSKIFPVMKTNTRTLNIILVVVVAIFGISYLVQINSVATKGYQIEELENKITELKEEQADLELEALSLQSMGTVKEKVDELGLVAIGEADYLQPTPVALAR